MFRHWLQVQWPASTKVMRIHTALIPGCLTFMVMYIYILCDQLFVYYTLAPFTLASYVCTVVWVGIQITVM